MAQAASQSSTTASFDPVKLRVFRAVIIIGLIGPVAAQVVRFASTGGMDATFAPALAVAGTSLFIWIWAESSKRYQAAIAAQMSIQTLLVSWAVLRSGGLRSDILIYFPLVILLTGFLLGRRGVAVSTIYSVIFMFALSWFEASGLIEHPIPRIADVTAQAICCSLSVGWIAHSYEKHRKQIEQDLRQRIDAIEKKEMHLRETQALAKIGSWEFDLATGNLTWSSEHYRIFEIEEPQPSQVLYQRYRERLHPDDVVALDENVEKTVQARKGNTFDHRVVFDEGARIKYLRGISEILTDENGNPVLIRGTCQDRTEAHLAQLEIESERTKALHNAKLASLGEMAAGIAHEINNPLAVIAGNVPLIRRNLADPVKVENKLAVIERAASRIQKIVLGLKKFSRSPDQGERKLESLSSIVQEALIFVEPKSSRSGVPVRIEVETDGQILCDAVEIEQVLVNLIGNGIDAIKDSDGEKWVRLRAFDDANAIVVQVVDSGSGVPIEIEHKLFQPFFTTKAVGEGTGLGLSICKGILDQHSATLRLNRDFPTTCFEIRFVRETGRERELGEGGKSAA